MFPSWPGNQITGTHFAQMASDSMLNVTSRSNLKEQSKSGSRHLTHNDCLTSLVWTQTICRLSVKCHLPPSRFSRASVLEGTTILSGAFQFSKVTEHLQKCFVSLIVNGLEDLIFEQPNCHLLNFLTAHKFHDNTAHVATFRHMDLNDTQLPVQHHLDHFTSIF
jgi:hypothetical protein